LTIIRFAEFIHDKVINRKIPEKMDDADPPPAVIAKMDIENEEYSVLSDLLSDDLNNLFCALTAISIEYHYYHPQSKKVINVPKGPAQGHFKDLVEIKRLIAQATQQPDCRTTVVQYDSEDYRLDHAEGLMKLNHTSLG